MNLTHEAAESKAFAILKLNIGRLGKQDRMGKMARDTLKAIPKDEGIFFKMDK